MSRMYTFFFVEFLSDVWPSMVTHTWNLCSAFNPSKCTHTAVNTHTLWTHTRSSGQPMLRRPGSSWGFGALFKGLTSVVVLKVERALDIHSPHRQFLPDPRLEPASSGYKSDALSIRPRLPDYRSGSVCQHDCTQKPKRSDVCGSVWRFGSETLQRWCSKNI